MVRGGPGNYKLKLNNSVVEADTFILRDGGLLIQVSLLSISLKAVIKPPTDHMQMVDEEELMKLEPITPPIS